VKFPGPHLTSPRDRLNPRPGTPSLCSGPSPGAEPSGGPHTCASWFRLLTHLLLSTTVLSINAVAAEKAASSATRIAPPPNLSQPTDSTAQEYAAAVRRHCAAGEWPLAAAAFEKLSRNFGSRPECGKLLSELQCPMSQCLMELGQFDQALLCVEAALSQALTANHSQALLFKKAICLAKLDRHAEAVAAADSFTKLFPEESWMQPDYAAQHPVAECIPDALVLSGSCLLQEGRYHEALTLLQKRLHLLPQPQRSRASLLAFQSLLLANDLAPATDFFIAETSHLTTHVFPTSFHSLTLELSSRLLAEGEPRNALLCLSKAWTCKQIVSHQETRIKGIESALRSAGTETLKTGLKHRRLPSLAAEMRSDLESFRRALPTDSATRLRLASVYQTMERYREAALVLEDALKKLPSSDPCAESAALTLIQCWSSIQRWPRTAEAASHFASRFPNSQHLPLALYLRACATQNLNQYQEAKTDFSEIVRSHPHSELAPRALFQKGYTELLSDHPDQAATIFGSLIATLPNHPIAEDAAFWRINALSIAGEFAQCRSASSAYLAAHPKGQYRGFASFRNAHAAHSQRDFSTSLQEFARHLEEYPDHESRPEALLLTGDALMATGELEKAISAFRRIPPHSHHSEEAWFRVGKAFRQLDRKTELLAHMLAFPDQHPGSSRLAEAVYWAGWCHIKEGHPESARRLYWETIERLGDQPETVSVDELFPALTKLCKEPQELSKLRSDLERLAQDAIASQKRTLALRARWASARLHLTKEPQVAAQMLAEAASQARPDATPPLLLADFADALSSTHKQADSVRLWRELLRWHPNAPQKDRALAALALDKAHEGNTQAALDWIERFDKETPTSPLLGKVLLCRARLLGAHQSGNEPQQTLDRILREHSVPAREKAEALFELAALHMRSGTPSLAIPYCQRIYVTYCRWPDLVAKAYLLSGQAFEQIGDADAARRTYSELLGQKELQPLPEYRLAEKRLKNL
jgi:tetratricopeptide (TPR) repeat protein